MKKIIILSFAALIFVTTTSYAQWRSKKIKGNNDIATETRSTEDYNSVQCSGSLDYILVSGEEGQITIEGEANLLEYVTTEVKSGKLIIKTKKGYSLKSNWNKGIKVTIPFQDIDKVSLSGSGDLWTENTIVSSSFEASLAGSGDITIDIEAENIKCNVAGSGDLTMKGTTDKLVAKVAGSGDIHAFKLEANNTTVSVAGSGDAKVVSNISLDAKVVGSGDIVYKGNPSQKETKEVGSGDIESY